MHIDDIVQHADKFQVTLCSQTWKAPALLTCCVSANGRCEPYMYLAHQRALLYYFHMFNHEIF